MTYLQDRAQQTSTEELFEASLTGPFGGIQSELPLTEIEAIGFQDINNFILKKGVAQMRPGFTALPTMPAPGNEVIKAIPSFFNANGQFIQCVITPTRLLQWTAGGWTVIGGPAFTASNNNFSWDVLNYKLCFSQGVDKVFNWDGIGGAYTQVATSQPALYMAEIGLHLLIVNPAFPQRYYWSGIGDPTDWTGFTSGLNDIVNNLGPIQGLLKIGQFGYGFHKEGIIQIVPTGIGLSPFAFFQMVNHFPGLYAPYSLSAYVDKGQEYGVYLSTDNVNVFNGTSIETIGDMPLANDRRRMGARSRILTDVFSSTATQIYGFVTYSVSGQVYKAYWLIIPGLSVWLFNFDEGNWTRFSYAKTVDIGGEFTKFTGIRIIDLVGTIAAQNWTPAGLVATQNLPGVLLGFDDATNGFVDFTNYSEQPASITSGKLIFQDRRHLHTVKKFRLSYVDLGSVTYSVQLMNQQGQMQIFTFTVGTGTGDVQNYVQEFNLPGLRHQYIVSVPALSPASIVELAPMFQVGGEQRGGLIEN